MHVPFLEEAGFIINAPRYKELSVLSALSLSAPLALTPNFVGAYFSLTYLVDGSLYGVRRTGFAQY